MPAGAAPWTTVQETAEYSDLRRRKSSALKMIQAIGGVAHLLPLFGEAGKQRDDAAILEVVGQGGALGDGAEAVYVALQDP